MEHKNYLDLLENLSIMEPEVSLILMETREEILDDGELREYKKPGLGYVGELHYATTGSYKLGNIVFRVQDVYDIEDTTVYLEPNHELSKMFYADSSEEDEEATPEVAHTGENVNIGIEFILAGNATFTVKNNDTGNEFTYKITQHPYGNKPHWVQVLVKGEYKNVGVIFDGKTFKHYAKCQVRLGSTEFKAFDWVWRMLRAGATIPSNITLQHLGKCGRCGRTLRITDSIVKGLGPVCAKKLGLA